MQNIRNFAIIAHVDHGKSTLADRLLEICHVVKKEAHEEQMLDRNPISRERGITIKLAPVRMKYGNIVLNLIDTPGHVDFSYEVDRTLACVEGAILLVDATQGVQAQTISNTYKALEKNLTIIPVINKIDLAGADIQKTKKQLIELLGVSEEEIFEISAKTGQGVQELLEAVVEKVPTPSQVAKNLMSSTVQALIFDSYYDSHRGVIAFIRVFEGGIKKGLKVTLAAQNIAFEAIEVGKFTPDLIPTANLGVGEIGYVVTNLKDIHKVRVGDTITVGAGSSALGYRKVKSMVFASVFPTDPAEYMNLKKALEKLYLNDSSLEFSAIYSKALGAGFRVGFLGLLHADVVRERLEREYNLSLVLTPPQVDYEIRDGEFFEPIIKILIITPNEYVGNVMSLCEDYRARFITMDNKEQISLVYEMPMSEMISGFFDKLKSQSSGFASLDWELLRHELVKADRLEILLNGDPVEEFSEVVVAERAEIKARDLVKRLRDVIPRQQYEVKIQAKYKGKIIASEKITPFRKDVTAKLYGGDRTRKDKLLDRQKKGKKQLKMVGKVEIPKEAFLKLFKN
jgi:GTP-binding protein LepA